MITSTYGLTATERVLPRLALDFTTAVADPRVVTARAANTATRFNQNGLIEIVNANLPRYDFSPTALTCQGQLIEEARSNLFLNSLIDGTNLSTQSVTLSAVAYTLSFYGSGSVAISGGHSATVSGVGDFPNRKTYTFTPTAGSSTFTVSGDVKFAQLEPGAFATSYIPTTTTSLTRNADVVSMTGTNFSDWYNASQGSFLVQGDLLSGAFPSSANLLSVADNANADFMRFWVWNGAANTLRWAGSEAGPSQFDLTRPYTANTTFKALGVYKVNDFAFGVDGGALVTDNAGAVITSADKMILGSKTGFVEFMSGHLAKILYWPQRVLNAEIQSFSK